LLSPRRGSAVAVALLACHPRRGSAVALAFAVAFLVVIPKGSAVCSCRRPSCCHREEDLPLLLLFLFVIPEGDLLLPLLLPLSLPLELSAGL
jgi:hypothetical protein